MSLRTIMIFPQFHNVGVIDRIREKYDPLSGLVRPHITIVFPFDMEMTNEELSKVLDLRLKDIKPFEVELQGFSKKEDHFGNYLFMDMIKGKEDIKQIHDILYNNEFSCCNLGLEYVPHITVGKVETVEKLNRAYEDIYRNATKFTTRINKISVEMIGENGESIIILEKKLN